MARLYKVCDPFFIKKYKKLRLRTGTSLSTEVF
jgi:hypothetical protein